MSHVVILGAGSLGSVIGGMLSHAGYDVTLIGRPAHVAAIEQNGLRISGIVDIIAHPHATSDPASVQEAGLLLVAVKTRDTMAALQSVRHMEVDAVASIQNGVLKDEQLIEFFGKDPVIGATTITGATLIGPGHTAYTLDGYSFFGEIGGGVSPRVQAIVDMYSKAGLKVQAAPDIVSTEWSKLVQSGPAMLVSAVTRLEYYKVCKGPDTARLFVAITKECAAVARACGVAIADYPGFNVKTVADASDEDALRMIIRRGEDMEERGMTSGRISMLQDILAGRKTEIEEIAGYLVRLAQEKGVAVPATEFAYHVVRGIEHWL